VPTAHPRWVSTRVSKFNRLRQYTSDVRAKVGTFSALRSRSPFYLANSLHHTVINYFFGTQTLVTFLSQVEPTQASATLETYFHSSNSSIAGRVQIPQLRGCLPDLQKSQEARTPRLSSSHPSKSCHKKCRPCLKWRISKEKAKEWIFLWKVF
jgi:hypothetical protein